MINRGVEKRKVVLDDKDRLRFIHDLYAFNDLHAAPNYILPGRHRPMDRELLVNIHAFCLMDNHYHLILSEVYENGISLFLKKLNGGYAKYFNEKYERSGALWQGKTKKLLLERDAHFLYLPYYVHLNPLDYKYKQWRQGAVRERASALNYLNQYRWSSYLDYIGIRNFPSVIHMDLIADILGSRSKQEHQIEEIISSKLLGERSSSVELKDN